jgi:hypothetical protein
MAIQRIFKSALPSFRFFSAAGLAANFINGRFTTDNKELEDSLMKEVGNVGRNKSQHPYIFVDEAEAELDTEALSPLELIKLQAKEEARAELLAEIKAQSARANDAGANVSSTTADFKSSLNNSAKVADVVGDSNASDKPAASPSLQVSTAATMASRLANLTAPKA